MKKLIKYKKEKAEMKDCDSEFKYKCKNNVNECYFFGFVCSSKIDKITGKTLINICETEGVIFVKGE